MTNTIAHILLVWSSILFGYFVCKIIFSKAYMEQLTKHAEIMDMVSLQMEEAYRQKIEDSKEISRLKKIIEENKNK